MFWITLFIKSAMCICRKFCWISRYICKRSICLLRRRATRSSLLTEITQDALSAEYTDNQNVKNLTSNNGAVVTLYAVWKGETGILANGNMLINGVEYAYTSFVKVMDTQVTIDGTDDNWSSYLDSSASAQDKGAFINGSISQYLLTNAQTTS